MAENIKLVMVIDVKCVSTCCHVQWQEISHVRRAEKKNVFSEQISAGFVRMLYSMNEYTPQTDVTFL